MTSYALVGGPLDRTSGEVPDWVDAWRFMLGMPSLRPAQRLGEPPRPVDTDECSAEYLRTRTRIPEEQWRGLPERDRKLLPDRTMTFFRHAKMSPQQACYLALRWLG